MHQLFQQTGHEAQYQIQKLSAAVKGLAPDGIAINFPAQNLYRGQTAVEKQIQAAIQRVMRQYLVHKPQQARQRSDAG